MDCYWTPPVAVHALLDLEKQHVPRNILEPAVGAGNIAKVLVSRGHNVRAQDIADHGYPSTLVKDFLSSELTVGAGEGIITNPPFKHAAAFASKAVENAPYTALLLRLNFLESARRKPWLEKNPPNRILIASYRLPMMHRQGWTGKRNRSNVCFAWFIWDRGRSNKTDLKYFDWRDHGTAD